jgi:hypothetical protein
MMAPARRVCCEGSLDQFDCAAGGRLLGLHERQPRGRDEVRDGGQRLIEFVRQRRRHLAHRAQATEMRQFLLHLQDA